MCSGNALLQKSVWIFTKKTLMLIFGGFLTGEIYIVPSTPQIVSM